MLRNQATPPNKKQIIDYIIASARLNKKPIIAFLLISAIIIIGGLLLLTPLGLAGATAAGLAILIAVKVGMAIARITIEYRTARQRIQTIDQSQPERDKSTLESPHAKVVPQVREAVALKARSIDYLAQAKSFARRWCCCFSAPAEPGDTTVVSGNRPTNTQVTIGRGRNSSR